MQTAQFQFTLQEPFMKKTIFGTLTGNGNTKKSHELMRRET